MKRVKRMEHGHIAQRSEGKYLVRWHGEDKKQIRKIIKGNYGQTLACLA